MLCDVILPFFFLTFCQTDETLAGYAQRGRAYDLVELQGAPATLDAVLRLPGRKQITLDTPCQSITARLSVPLPWFALRAVALDQKACAGTEPQLDALLQSLSLAEIAGDTILLSSDAGVAMVFRSQD